MITLAGLVLLVIGGGMFAIGMPRQGVSPRFMQAGIVEALYPVTCLGALVMGVALLIKGMVP
jgi:hypothetical protein